MNLKKNLNYARNSYSGAKGRGCVVEIGHVVPWSDLHDLASKPQGNLQLQSPSDAPRMMQTPFKKDKSTFLVKNGKGCNSLSPLDASLIAIKGGAFIPEQK